MPIIVIHADHSLWIAEGDGISDRKFLLAVNLECFQRNVGKIFGKDGMKDQFKREINYMRISITDLCNLRCVYCMPNGVEHVLPMTKILTYEEILRIVKEAVKLGITRYKITGGEPLVRKGCVDLIRMISGVKGVEEVTMTSNGILLGEMAVDLYRAGLRRVNVSLDSLNREKFKEITGFDALNKVRDGIKKAKEAGILTKVNTVLQKNVNEQEWKEIANLAKDEGIAVRFIELMPIGHGDENMGISNEELLARMEDHFGRSTKDHQMYGNGPARYVTFPDFQAPIGFISAMHGTFCDSCNRIRLSSTGKLKPCLCFAETVDLREILRGGGLDEDLREGISEAIYGKPRAHAFLEKNKITEKKGMSSIGG